MRDKVSPQKIASVRQRAEDLRQQYAAYPGSASDLVAEPLRLLSVTLEELQASEEELRRQNQELAIAQRDLEAERRRYKEMFDLAPNAYVVTDGKGTIQEANRAAAALLHVRQDHLDGKPLLIYAPEDDRKSIQSLLVRFRRENLHEVQDWSTRIQPRDGEPLVAVVTIAAIRDGKGLLTGLRWSIRESKPRPSPNSNGHAAEKELECLTHERTADLLHANIALQAEINRHRQIALELREQLEEMSRRVRRDQ